MGINDVNIKFDKNELVELYVHGCGNQLHSITIPASSSKTISVDKDSVSRGIIIGSYMGKVACEQVIGEEKLVFLMYDVLRQCYSLNNINDFVNKSSSLGWNIDQIYVVLNHFHKIPKEGYIRTDGVKDSTFLGRFGVRRDAFRGRGQAKGRVK